MLSLLLGKYLEVKKLDHTVSISLTYKYSKSPTE